MTLTLEASKVSPARPLARPRGNGMFCALPEAVASAVAAQLGLSSAYLLRLLGRSPAPRRIWILTEALTISLILAFSLTLILTEAARAIALDPRIQFLNGGLEVLRFASGPGDHESAGWRLCQEGVAAMAPLLPPERVIALPPEVELAAGCQPVKGLGVEVGVDGPVVLQILLAVGGTPVGVVAAHILPGRAMVHLSSAAVARAAQLQRRARPP